MTMVTDTIKQKVLEMWRNPSVGLTGLSRFREKLRQENVNLSTSEIRRIVESDPSHALHTYNPKARVWNTIVETGVGTGMQMDLMDMSKIASRNKNVHWILCIIDVYSRYAWAFPVKRKTQQCIYQCLKGWLQKLSKPPQRVTSDAGTEFTNSQVRALMNSFGIVQYTNQAGDKTTTGIVERFNRTLREYLGRNFTRIGKLHWVDDLPKIVNNYNHSRHSTLGATPDDVWHRRASPMTRIIHRERFPFQEGDTVRTLLPQGVFDKRAGSQRWSTEVYTIVRRDGFKYVLRDNKNKILNKKYRPSHLVKVRNAEQESGTGDARKKKSTREQLRHAATQQKQQRILRTLGAPPPRNRRHGLRPSTRKRNLRSRKKKTEE